MSKLTGILAIQGDFQAHINALMAIGAEYREIRNSKDLEGVSNLIVPGGESTTISKIAKYNGLWEKLSQFDGPVMGTCMGSILMADTIEASKSKGWGMIDMSIRRNAYGRQVHSFTALGKIAFINGPFEMIFIRAPRIIQYDKNVKPIAWLDKEVVGVISGNKLALTFHPELSGNSKVHEYFLNL